MSLSIAEMEGELAEFVPAREVMCGGCCGGTSYTNNYSNNHQSFDNDPGAGNDSNGFANGAFSPSDDTNNGCIQVNL